MATNTGEVGGVSFADGTMTSQGVAAKSLQAGVADQTTIQRNASTGALEVKDGGVTAAKMSAKAGRRLTGSLTAADGAAGVLSLVNPFGVDVFIDRFVLIVTTPPAGACTVDAGYAATSISSDNMIDGLDITTGGAGKSYSSADSGDKGTNGKNKGVWKTGEYVTISKATGATASLVGRYTIDAIDYSA